MTQTYLLLVLEIGIYVFCIRRMFACSEAKGTFFTELGETSKMRSFLRVSAIQNGLGVRKAKEIAREILEGWLEQ